MTLSSDAYLGLVSALVALITFVLSAALGSLVLMFTWNAAMPFIFHLPTINFIQAFCLGYTSRSLLQVTQFKQAEKKEYV